MGVEERSQLEQVQDIFDILHGRKEADLLMKNLNILDVHGETVYQGSLLIDHGKIVALSPDEDAILVKEVFDGQGLYAIPGLIDAHFHFESQLANPTALAEVMVPNGTTTVFAEILDLISSAGDEGVEATKKLFKDYKKLPYRIYAFAPGKKVKKEITKEILDMEPIIGLGEFDHFSYREGNSDDFEKLAWAREKGYFINGHWGLTVLSDMELNFLPAAGVTNNHDVWNLEDLQKSVRYGFGTQIKFGVGSPEVIKTLLTAIQKEHYPLDQFMFCADNFSVHRLTTDGHMDYIINLANEMGFDPIKTIKMASFNAARFFHLDHVLGSLTPGRYADIVLTDSLAKVNPLYVFKGGELVAQDRKILKNATIDYTDMETEGVPGLGNLKQEELDVVPFRYSEDGKSAEVYLFDVFGRGHADFYKKIWLPVKDGKIVPEYNGQKLCRISVIQRYAHGERYIVNGYFTGMYIGRGAVGTSFPAPVPYLVVAGMDSSEMWYCAQEIDKYSGICIVSENNRIKAKLPIKIYGMMVNMPASELRENSDAIDEAVKELGNDNTIGEPVVNKLLSLFISLHRFGFMKE